MCKATGSMPLSLSTFIHWTPFLGNHREIPGDGRAPIPRGLEVDDSAQTELGRAKLGQVVSCSISSAHRGHVTVTGTEGRGSIFRVELPMAKRRTARVLCRPFDESKLCRPDTAFKNMGRSSAVKLGPLSATQRRHCHDRRHGNTHFFAFAARTSWPVQQIHHHLLEL